MQEFSEKAWRSISDSRNRINLWHGAVRSGKTISSLIAFGLRVGNRDPEGQYMMVGRTLQTLERNCILPLVSIFGKNAISYRPFQSRMRMFGRLVFLVGANDESAADKIRGVTLTDAYGDELTTWPESVFVMLMLRLSVPNARFYGTTNPDSPGHWLKRNYLDRAAELEVSHWQFSLNDNPALDPKYVAALKREYTGLWYRRFVEGAWVQAEGAVYDQLPDEMFLSDEDPMLAMAREFGDRYFLIDYGTTNPFVCLDSYVYKNKLYIADEWRHDSIAAGRQMSNSEYAAELVKLAGHPDYVRSCVVDPSAASFKLDLQRARFAVRDGVNAVLDGIRQTSSIISQGRLFINKDKCEEAVRELRGYRWDSRAANNGHERPVKEADHGPDALRYGVATLRLASMTEIDDDGPYEITLY